MLKQMIKDLSAEQTRLKKERKTGSLPTAEIMKASNKAAEQVRRNAIKITAALNLYHEIRGSSYRHNVKDDLQLQYWYKKDCEELRAKLDAPRISEKVL